MSNAMLTEIWNVRYGKRSKIFDAIGELYGAQNKINWLDRQRKLLTVDRNEFPRHLGTDEFS